MLNNKILGKKNFNSRGLNMCVKTVAATSNTKHHGIVLQKEPNKKKSNNKN